MDEPSLLLGSNHRKYRHDPNVTPTEAKKIFGELADAACLDHIRLDELESNKNNNEGKSTGQLVNFTIQSPAGEWYFQSEAIIIIKDGKKHFSLRSSNLSQKSIKAQEDTSASIEEKSEDKNNEDEEWWRNEEEPEEEL